MTATGDYRKRRQCAGTCVTGILLMLSLPIHALADGAPARGSAVSSDIQMTTLTPATFGTSSAVIGAIVIVNDDIFDPEIPEENKLFYRLANKAHATTRRHVIRQQLLFKEGDEFSPRVLEETERLLRNNRFIQDATIEPVPNEKGIVDIKVHTTDVWTLIPKVSISRSGGANDIGIGIKEMNLLGTGIKVEVIYKSDIDRDSKTIKIQDRHLGNSWYGLDALYSNNSDGHAYLFGIAKPFYSLGSTSSQGFSFLNYDQIDSLYDRGEVMAQFRDQTSSYEVFRGWSDGLNHGWTSRYTSGLAFEEHQFSSVDASTAPISMVPDDRLFVYPFVGIEFVQDRFEKTRNLDQINRTEDRFLGTRFGARLGIARTSFGSDRNAWLISAGAQTGFGNSLKNSLILSSSLATRVEDEGLQDFAVNVSARYYRRQSDRRLFYANLSGTYGHNLDLDNQILLGGDNGLRGYPLRYQTGDKSALLTLEQRFFTDWYPFRLFQVGGAVFFDAGRTWGDSFVSDQNDGLLKDIGFGLRIGNTRSGQGRMTHIDFAFPLDGDDSIKDVQFLIETKKSF